MADYLGMGDSGRNINKKISDFEKQKLLEFIQSQKAADLLQPLPDGLPTEQPQDYGLAGKGIGSLGRWAGQEKNVGGIARGLLDSLGITHDPPQQSMTATMKAFADTGVQPLPADYTGDTQGGSQEDPMQMYQMLMQQYQPVDYSKQAEAMIAKLQPREPNLMEKIGGLFSGAGEVASAFDKGIRAGVRPATPQWGERMQEQKAQREAEYAQKLAQVMDFWRRKEDQERQAQYQHQMLNLRAEDHLRRLEQDILKGTQHDKDFFAKLISAGLDVEEARELSGFNVVNVPSRR